MNLDLQEPITKEWITSLLAEGLTTYDIVSNYKLSEEVILDSHELLDKEVIIQGISLSEDFIRKAIEIEYFDESDIFSLSMSTYANFTADFISKFAEVINWNRMILYISTQSDNFDEYIEIIEKDNLWSVISANDLSIDFIRDWKDKLDWRYLSMVKCFTDEEKEEFSGYIMYEQQEEIQGDFIDKSQFDFVKNMTDEELESLIEEINKQLYPKDWPK